MLTEEEINTIIKGMNLSWNDTLELIVIMSGMDQRQKTTYLTAQLGEEKIHELLNN